MQNRSSALVSCLSQLALLGVLACGCSDSEPDEPKVDAGAGDASAPAVMVATQVITPDSFNLYVGAYPELPSETDLSGMLEVSGGNDARAHDGHIFVWNSDKGEYTRYEVDDTYALVHPKRVSFANLGGTGNVMTHFISSTRAYSLTRANLQIIIWNPSTMEILGDLSAESILDEEYPNLDVGEPVLFDGQVAWPVLWADEDDLRFKRSVGVLLAKADSDEPVTVLRDDRCGGGWSLFTDSAGDLYATGNAWFGFAHFFGEGAASYPNDCLLRIKKGTLEFDPDYYVDLNKLADSPAVYFTWHVRERSLFAAVWDKADNPKDLKDPDEYWSAEFSRKLLLIDEGKATEVAEIPKSAVFSTLNYRLDDTLFMLVSEGSPSESGRSSLYRVTESGAEQALTTKGQLWSIGRVR